MAKKKKKSVKKKPFLKRVVISKKIVRPAKRITIRLRTIEEEKNLFLK